MLLICTASSGQNRVMAERLFDLVKSRGHSANFIDLTEYDLPVFTPRSEVLGTPPIVSTLKGLFQGAHGFVFCSPEYNGSIPPVLTNTLAWLSVDGDDFRSLFNGKPAALCTYSGGNGEKVLMAMRIQLSHLGCTVWGSSITANKNKPMNEKRALKVVEEVVAFGQL